MMIAHRAKRRSIASVQSITIVLFVAAQAQTYHSAWTTHSTKSQGEAHMHSEVDQETRSVFYPQRKSVRCEVHRPS